MGLRRSQVCPHFDLGLPGSRAGKGTVLLTKALPVVQCWGAITVPPPPNTLLDTCGYGPCEGLRHNIHVQRLLGLGGFFLRAVADHSIALGQIQVECDEGPMLQTQRPQRRTINLRRKQRVGCDHPGSCCALQQQYGNWTHCVPEHISFHRLTTAMDTAKCLCGQAAQVWATTLTLARGKAKLPFWVLQLAKGTAATW